MASSSKQKAEAETGSVTKLKYMGSSHVRIIEKGDLIGGELVEGVPSTVVWDLDNHHIAEVDWSETQVSALLEHTADALDGKPEFIDVTGEERAAPSLGQILWRGASPRKKLAEGDRLPGVVTTLSETPPSEVSVAGTAPAGGGTTAPATSTGG